jgi:hypothetical protein
MTQAEKVLGVECEFSDEPLEIEEIDGLPEAIKEVAESEDKQLVRCEDRVSDYDVYWNEKTGTVRVAAVVPGASYEVPEDYVNGVES